MMNHGNNDDNNNNNNNDNHQFNYASALANPKALPNSVPMQYNQRIEQVHVNDNRRFSRPDYRTEQHKQQQQQQQEELFLGFQEYSHWRRDVQPNYEQQQPQQQRPQHPSPIGTPIRKPVQRPTSNIPAQDSYDLQNCKYLWQNGHQIDNQLYPRNIPTLNGTPYLAGQSTPSPTPVGSSRNSSPRLQFSGGSSPIIPESNGRTGTPNTDSSNTPPPSGSGYNSYGATGSSCASSPEIGASTTRNCRCNSIQRCTDCLRQRRPIMGTRAKSAPDNRKLHDMDILLVLNDCISQITSPQSSLRDSPASDIQDNVALEGGDFLLSLERSFKGGANRSPPRSPQQVVLPANVHDNLELQGAAEMLPYEQNVQVRANQSPPASPQHVGLPGNLHANTELQGAAPMLPYEQNLQVKANQSPAGSPERVVAPANSRQTPLTRPCEQHNLPRDYYCQTCLKMLCIDCGPLYHYDHVVMHVDEATKLARQKACLVLDEIRYSMDTIEEEIRAGENIAAKINQSACEAATMASSYYQRLTDEVRRRERELMENIRAAVLSKYAGLRVRDEVLKGGLNRLNMTGQTLDLAMNTMSLGRNPLELIVAGDRAASQLSSVQNDRYGLPLVEQSSIRFHVNERQTIDVIKTFGAIQTGNGHVADRRHSARPNSQPLAVPQGNVASRAVAGLRRDVSIAEAYPPTNNNPFAAIGRGFTSIGWEENGDNNLCRPWGVACDSDGRIVVADRSNNRIQVYKSNGRLLWCFGSHGNAVGQFDRPAGVAVDKRRRIVVADKDNHRIQLFTMRGDFLLAFGQKGSSAGSFNYPWDVATNEAAQIVVSDTRNHRIQLFSAEGIFLRKFGFETQPTHWKNLDSPRGVVFNKEGNVLVTDFNGHRVVVVDADFMSARVLGYDTINPQPTPNKMFLRPQGIAVDDCGHIIVADSRNHRVRILNSDGQSLHDFGTDQMDRPSGVAVTHDGHIVVVDFGNNRVLKY